MANIINGRITSFTQYLHLKEINSSLAEENARLKNQLDWYLAKDTLVTGNRLDTTKGIDYAYMKAEIINNSTNRQHNYITLDKGYNEGVRTEMGVVSSDGIVGVVNATSPKYATVVSILNTNFKVSARLKRTDYFGSLSWDGKDYRFMVLSDIPQHAKIKLGDTVETSGYSTIFPPGIFIGVVEDFKVQGGNFFALKIKLHNDMKRLKYVDVVTSYRKEEKQKLETTAANE